MDDFCEYTSSFLKLSLCRLSHFQRRSILTPSNFAASETPFPAAAWASSTLTASGVFKSSSRQFLTCSNPPSSEPAFTQERKRWSAIPLGPGPRP